MAEPIRLLVVDDVRDHAQLVAEFIGLTDGWSDARVDLAPSYEEALRHSIVRPSIWRSSITGSATTTA